jgi:short subunit dehydrogenase-like uncharacterized protein
MSGRFMIYGATGYTGKLVAQAAAARGLAPLLAGRNKAKLEAVAAPLGLEHRAFELTDRTALDAALAGIEAVLLIAGPFSHTSRPMLDACLRNGRHYLDITGEIDVFEDCAGRESEARQAKIMIMPGVGFDVVPTDCLAAHLKRRLPAATALTLALGGFAGMSHGTAKTAVESIGFPTRVRRGGTIVPLNGKLQRQIDFGDGPRPALAIGWGDVATAHYSTGIPDITVFFEAMPQIERLAKLGGFTRWVLRRTLVQAWLKRQVEKQPEGPSEAERAAGTVSVFGEAVDAEGRRVVARLHTPEAYTMTAEFSLEIMRRVLTGEARPGFQTPSMMFGPDFITGFAGCRREDVEG